ncbi:hypothetical protein DSO57_1039504, partial [Entomophthora muscae]
AKTILIFLKNFINLSLSQSLLKKVNLHPIQTRSLWLLIGVLVMGLDAYFSSSSCTTLPGGPLEGLFQSCTG